MSFHNETMSFKHETFMRFLNAIETFEDKSYDAGFFYLSKDKKSQSSKSLLSPINSNSSLSLHGHFTPFQASSGLKRALFPFFPTISKMS